MKARTRIRIFTLLAALVLAGTTGCLAPHARESLSAEAREPVDHYVLSKQEALSTAGCRYDYRVFTPQPPSAPPASPEASATTVILGHGFLRNQNTLVDLARALANAGFRAATLDFCNMRPWNGHHRRNADDLIDLANRLKAESIVYAGFSAGALAALLAGSSDARTAGVITLDLVDQAGMGATALASLQAPVFGLQGPPSSCNANGSGQRAFDTRPALTLVTLATASHCEFESPTNRWCELACGDDDPDGDNDVVRADIIQRVVNIVDNLQPQIDSPAPGAAAPRASL